MKSRIRSWSLPAITAMLIAVPASAQVSMDSWYVNSADVEENKQILVAMGGKAAMMGQRQVVEFPGVTVYLNAASPTSGSAGSVMDHVGLWVQNVEASVAQWQAAGVPVELARPTQAWVTTPDGLRIEILQNDQQAMPIQHHHLHYNVPRAAIAEAQEWYNEVFGAVPGMRGNFQAADIPGANLTFSGTDESKIGTKGTVLDRVGFKVQGLEALCQRLEGRSDVQLDQPCERDGMGVVRARLTDPWGTVVELREGGASSD